MSENNPKRLLLDLQRELDGDPLVHVCTVHGFKWEMKLLNEEESNWRNAYVNTGTTLSAVSSWKLPTLAIGIRKMGSKDGDLLPVFEFFRDEWESTEELRAAAELIEGKGAFSQKYFSAEHLMEWLAARDPKVVSALYTEWQKLEKRREDAQAGIKKSSGESSDEGENPSGTELSPSGDE